MISFGANIFNLFHVKNGSNFILSCLHVIFIEDYFCVIYISGLLVTFHQSVLKSLLPLLMSQRMAVRKRTIIAIGKYCWLYFLLLSSL